MKAFSRFATENVSVYLCVALMALLSACGDDSKTSSRVPEEDLAVDESSSSNAQKGSSSSLETIVDVKEGSVVEADSIDVSEYLQEGSVLDKRNKRSYNLLVSGIGIWTDENIDYKTTSPKSTCYDYDDSLCVKYGRLYSDADKDICPEGFSLPRADDFRLLVESKEDYNAQYAGYCNERRAEPIVCGGVGDTAFYVTQDDSLVAISKNGSLKVLKNDGRFASVRCMKEKSIVEKQKELPKCVSAYKGRVVFVIEKDSAYTCNGSDWEFVESYSACNSGEKYVYGEKSDFLYTCTERMWRLASLDDMDKPCINENRHKNVVFNGARYACSKYGWVELEYPASQLGECYSEIFGTVSKTDSNQTFTCKNTGKWVPSGPTDIYGACTSKLSGEIVTIDTVQWFCKTRSLWSSSAEVFDWISNKDNINGEFGFCTKDRYRDTVLYNEYYYRCTEYNEWQQQTDSYMLPSCNSNNKNSMWDSTIFIGHKEYLCNRWSKSWQLLEHELFDNQTDSVSCNMENYGKIYSWGDYKYICSLNKNRLGFNQATDIELKYGVCGLDTVYAVTEDDVYYSCKEGTWSNRQLERCEAKYGWCSPDTVRTEVYADSGCFCSGGSWENRQLEVVEIEYGEICEKGRRYVIFYGDKKYECKDGYMYYPTSITVFDYKNVFGECEGEMHGKDTIYYDAQFVCDTTLDNGIQKWYRYGEADSLAGTYCQKAIEGLDIKLRDDSHVVCNGVGTWIKQDFSEYMGVCNEDSVGVIKYNGVTHSVCLGDRWAPADTFHVTDVRDGKEYAAITIDGVTWMAEPLRYVPEGKTVYVDSSMYPVSAEDVKDDEAVYYTWVVAMNLDESYERIFAKPSVIKSNTIVQGVCMDGWHIPRYEEVREKLTSKIYYRLQGYKKVYDDNDIVGIHLMGRNELTIERDTIAGVDSVSSVNKLAFDYMWTIDETDNLFLRSSRYADVAVIRKDYGTDHSAKIKYGAAPVRCVKDDE